METAWARLKQRDGRSYRLNVKLDLVSSLKNIDVASVLVQLENLKSNITANLATKESIPIKGAFFDNFVASVKGRVSSIKLFRFKNIVWKDRCGL